MKSVFFFLFLLVISPLFGQVKIGDNVEVIDNSSILELESTSKGLLIPRLTTEQINTIEEPATGLLVYNTDVNLLQINTGTTVSPQWKSLAVSQLDDDNKGAITLPVGTDADRPVNPVEGMLRYNAQNSSFECYRSGAWENLSR